MVGKDFEKNNLVIAVIFFHARSKKKYNFSRFKNITQCVKSISSFHYSRSRRMVLYYSKKLPELLRGVTSKHNGDLYC